MEMEINLHDADHKSMMATMSVYGEIPFKNLCICNKWNDFDQTLYVAPATLVHLSLFK